MMPCDDAVINDAGTRKADERGAGGGQLAREVKRAPAQRGWWGGLGVDELGRASVSFRWPCHGQIGGG